MNGHKIHSWCSQPLLNKRLHAGDLLSAASILLSGNNYQKIAHFAKFLRLPFLCATTFSKIQKTYLIPAVDEYWCNHQENILANFRGRDIAILGNCANHSICTHTYIYVMQIFIIHPLQKKWVKCFTQVHVCCAVHQ